jgi:hypothetical protein
MTGNGDLRFVGELPEGLQRGRGHFDALCLHPWEWAEYWGKGKGSIHATAARAHRPGFACEGAVRNGVAYIRAVPVTNGGTE